MALSDGYLITMKNLEAFFVAVQAGQAPERFTQKFLEQLGFKGTNDRLFIKLLKNLEFIDDSGVPLPRYFEYLDQSKSKAILAKAIQEAYEDLFVINRQAQNMTRADVKNKLRTLTQGKKSDVVIGNMAGTFVALCEYADWDGLKTPPNLKGKKEPKGKSESKAKLHPKDEHEDKVEDYNAPPNISSHRLSRAQLHYNIQIHLPESRDSKVYDAIFESLMRHLI